MRTLYTDQQWDRAYYRYSDVWIMLNSVKRQHPNLVGTQPGTIDELVVRLQENERSLDRAVRSQRAPAKIPEHIKVLQRLQALLNDLLINLQ